MISTVVLATALINPKIWVTFLEKGPTAFPTDPALLNPLLANHLSNLEALRLSGKLVNAGPVESPEGNLLGLAFFDTAKQQEITDAFAADQMVQKGYFSLRTARMQVVLGVLHPKPIDPKKTVPVVLAIAHRVGKNKKGAFARHEAFLRADPIYAGLRFVCRGASTDPEQELHYYVGTSTADVLKMLSNDPLVSTGSWVYEAKTQRIPKGALADVIE